ncbi:MAG: tetratricopeptide repeat protein, partial [Bacteroidota bacterium]
AALLYEVVNTPAKPLKDLRSDVPDELQRILGKAMEKNASDRYQDVDEMLVELKRFKQESETRAILKHKGVQFALQKKRLRWIAAAAVGVLALVALYVFFPSKPIPVEDKSIAVLPFADMSPAKDQEYFCDGMADELINALAKLGGLHVAARTSAFQFKGKNVDVRTIGEKLNVSTVLEGSVRKAGNTLRITAQLINVADGYHLWSETYERQLEDVFAVQEEISRSIVNALKVKLVGGEDAPIVKRYTDDVEAYNLYLKGRYYWNKRTEEGLKKGLEYFQQAIERDPTYALAYAGMADSYIVLVDWSFLPPHEAHPKAKAAARKALEIENTLAEAHNSLAYVNYIYDWDWLEAEAEYKRALELNPDYATAHQWYAEYLTAMERFDEAIAEIKRAKELDPLSLIINAVHGWVLYYADQYDEAIEQCLKTLEMDPNFYPAQLYILWCYWQQGKQKEAIEQWKDVATLEGASSEQVAALGNAFTKTGMKGAWQWQLDRLKENSKRTYIPSVNFAIAYARLGENDKAFEWLEKAYEERSPTNVWLKIAPDWDSLRSDPRFAALLKKVGLE